MNRSLVLPLTFQTYKGLTMSNAHNRRSASSCGNRLATTNDVLNRIRSLAGDRSECLPPQAPPFLGNLPPAGTAYEPQQPATVHLKSIIQENYYSRNFEAAIATVASQNIPELDQITTLEQFYFYVDALVTWIPEIRVWEWHDATLHERTVYLRITQFYYYFNQLELEALQSPIGPVAGEDLSPISKWLREFAVDWGEFLDKPESRDFLESFKYAPEYSWQDYEKAPEDYATFNEYFARQFASIDTQRPVASANDDRVIVFPAESTFVGQWPVSTPVGDPMPAPPSIMVKQIRWSIEELLQDSEHAAAFEGGLICHSFLNTYDYHRLHTSVAGNVLEAKFIPGQVYLEVQLETLAEEVASAATSNEPVANAVIPQRYLDADDATGYQFVQCRGLIVLESAIGKVAILPMGMAQVSSVVFVTPKAEGHKPIVLTAAEKENHDYCEQVNLLNRKIKNALVGKHYEKGEMFSYFQFGGSDCVMVFERKANVAVTAAANIHYPIRSQYAVSNINR